MDIENLPKIDEKYLFEDGMLFIGEDERLRSYGVKTPRHALTFAGSRAGKGTCCIIPNLYSWIHNVLVIDPKGEAAEATSKTRKKERNQNVYVVDPFEFSNVDDEFRAAYNPLDELDTDSIMIQEQINAITDGIIMRHDPRHAMWDNNAQGILSGLIAFIKLAEPPENQNLIHMREILRTEEILEAAKVMKQYDDCGGIMQTAASTIESENGSQFIENARENTKWIDSLPMKNTLANDNLKTFKLSKLKTENTSIYLVLPPNYLSQHGRFLRLFVRCALEAMGQKTPDGKLLAKRCLFILDEFYSLGRIDEIAKASGLMPGMGVHLWAFMQDLGQLTSLYGADGAQTFFGNSDLHQFFGNTDPNTLEFMSKLTGNLTASEVPLPPPAPVQAKSSGIVASILQSSQGGIRRAVGTGFNVASDKKQNWGNAVSQAEYQNNMTAYQQEMSRVGKARLAPDQLAKIVQRGEVVANKMFCVINGTDRAFVRPRFLASPVRESARHEYNNDTYYEIPSEMFWYGLWGGCVPSAALSHFKWDNTILTTAIFSAVAWVVVALLAGGIAVVLRKTGLYSIIQDKLENLTS